MRTLIKHTQILRVVAGRTLHARFVTPPSYPRRFDTVFFVAVANEGCNAAEAWVQQQQQPQPSQPQRGPEIVGAKWMGAREALASKLQLMPPQWLLLQQLAQHATIADVLKSCSHDLPQHRTIMPVVIKEQRDDGVKTYVLPGDVDHPVFPGQAGALSRCFVAAAMRLPTFCHATARQVLLPVAVLQGPANAAVALHPDAAPCAACTRVCASRFAVQRVLAASTTAFDGGGGGGFHHDRQQQT